MRSPFPSDDWTLAEGQTNGKPLVIRMRSAMPSVADRELLSRLIIVCWEYVPNESGMPFPDEHARMNVLEDSLESGTEQRGVAHQVLSMTGDGRKEWRYYTTGLAIFLESLNKDLAGHDPFPIEIYDFNDPEWNGLGEYLAAMRS